MSELISSYNDDLKMSGIPNQRTINIYEKFGHGGFGAIITGNISICHSHIEAPGCMAISVEGDSQESRSQFKRLADAGKSGGSLLIGQLNHASRNSYLIDILKFLVWTSNVRKYKPQSVFSIRDPAYWS